VTLLNGQGKIIMLSNVKRVEISSMSGLFVGGSFLKKMTGVAYPKIEKWITFPNIKGIGLGYSLPSGAVSVYYARENFLTHIGFSTISSVRPGNDVTIRMPSLLQRQKDQAAKDDIEYTFLNAQLIQESYKELNPALSEVEYRLIIKNSKDSQISLTITIDKEKTKEYSISRSNVSYEKNKEDEAFWRLEIPPNGTRELRYKLIIRNLA
jgi:hypothetical protein